LAAGLVNGEISLVGAGAVIVFLGVAFLGPVIARPVSDLIGWPLKKFRGITGELARENASRNPKRTASTAAALMIGVALVALITILASSTKESIGATIDQAFRADYIVAPKAGGFGGSGFSPELAEAVKALPEIETATGLRFGAAELDGKGKFLIAADPKALNQLFDLEPSNTEAFENLGPDQIAVSERIADEKGWKIGDTIIARFPSGGTTDLTVGARYGVGQQEGLSDYFVSLDTFTENYPEQFDAQVYATLRPGVSLEAGKKAMDRVVEPYANAEVEDQAEFKAKQQQSIDQFVNLIYALLFLAVIIAGIGIANTLALSIVERTREIGLLRAVGMTRSQLKSTIRWEAVIIAMLGTVLGLVIGLVFGWAIVQALSDQGINKFAPPGAQLIVIVLIAALLAVLFAYFPARRAAKLDVLRAISTE
ncbi:MAG: FtsX-like permease family protein, partial [Acidimicrobiia bacterium]